MLAARPQRNQAARVERDNPDVVRLTVRKRRPRLLLPPLSWIIRPRLENRYELEGLGLEVWQLCDGNRRVEDIVDAFAQRRRLTFHESRVAVTSYLKILVEKGALAMAVEAPKEMAAP